MHQAAFLARLVCAASIFIPAHAARAQSSEFASAAECRMQWDNEFGSYARQYKSCGAECWSGDARRHEYLRYSDWLARLENWHDYCRGMSGAERQPGDDAAPAAWPVSLRTEGQASCELIRSGEVKYRFQWREKHGRRCYSNRGVHKDVAACCP